MLENKGLVKLVEECGELVQIAAKKMTRMNSDEHWDGEGSLQSRLENEIADVIGAAEIVIKNFDLNRKLIIERSNKKFKLFLKWMDESEDACPTCKKNPCFEHCQFCGESDCQSDHK